MSTLLMLLPISLCLMALPPAAPVEPQTPMAVEVTTVARQESTVGRSPAAVFVITQDDIRRSGATNIAELFRRVPGMNVARIDNNKWAIGARGFNDRFNGTLVVQIDRRTIYDPLSSGVYWDSLDYPLEDIERIEIIRGPEASVWGANAVNGIVNIITKSAAGTGGGMAGGGFGTQDQGFGTFRYGGPAGDTFHYRVFGMGFARGEQHALSGDANDRWTGATGGMRIDGPLSARDELTIQAGMMNGRAAGRDLRPTAAPPYATATLEDEVTRAGYVLGSWRRRLGHDASWTLQASWDRFDRESDNGFVDLRFDTLDVDFEHRLAPGRRHWIVYGAGYRQVQARLGASAPDAGFAVSVARPERMAPHFSAFVQDQIALTNRALTLTVGSNVEHNPFSGFEVQPTARLLWVPSPRQSVWGAVSRAVRTPTLSEHEIGRRQLPSFPTALAGAPLFSQLQGNPDFDSEGLIAFESGSRTQAAAAVSVDVAVFYNAYDGLRATLPGATVPGIVPGTFELPLIYRNVMDGRTRGAELAVHWQAADWSALYGAYAFLDMDLRADGMPASAAVAESQSPRHQAFVQSSFDLPGGVELDLMGRFVDRLTGFSPEVDGYVALDCRVGFAPHRRLSIAIVGQNLLDDRHVEFGAAPPRSELQVQIGRGLHTTINWRF